MFDLRHFRLGLFLACLTAGFAFTACDDDDDDGGLSDAGGEGGNGGNGGGNAGQGGGQAGQGGEVTPECTVADDCAAQACKTASCNAEGKCEYEDVGNGCCTEDTECKPANSCMTGTCVESSSFNYKVCSYAVTDNCCQFEEGGSQCAEGTVCKTLPASKEESEEDPGEGGSEEQIAGETTGDLPDPTKDYGAASVCVECNVDADCAGKVELNGCQIAVCEENACKAAWTAENCCLVTAEGTEGCGSDRGYGDGFKCYDGNGLEVTPKAAATKDEDPVAVATDKLTDTTDGLGVCFKEADLAACKTEQNCDGTTLCIDTSNEEAAGDGPGETGARIRTRKDHCEIRVAEAVVDSKADTVYEAFCPAPDFEACDNIPTGTTCKRNSCDATDTAHKTCGIKSIANCCVPSTLGTIRDSGCTADGTECYTQNGSFVEVGEGNFGSCAKTSDVEASKDECKAEFLCDEDGKILPTTGVSVIDGVAACNKATPIDCPFNTECKEAATTTGKFKDGEEDPVVECKSGNDTDCLVTITEQEEALKAAACQKIPCTEETEETVCLDPVAAKRFFHKGILNKCVDGFCALGSDVPPEPECSNVGELCTGEVAKFCTAGENEGDAKTCEEKACTISPAKDGEACPTGSKCASVDDKTICVKECTAEADCPTGFVCDDTAKVCMKAPNIGACETANVFCEWLPNQNDQFCVASSSEKAAALSCNSISCTAEGNECPATAECKGEAESMKCVLKCTAEMAANHNSIPCDKAGEVCTVVESATTKATTYECKPAPCGEGVGECPAETSCSDDHVCLPL